MSGLEAPCDVVRVQVDPSVTLIPTQAFYQHKKLTKGELCEGLVEIGEHSFSRCDHSIGYQEDKHTQHTQED